MSEAHSRQAVGDEQQPDPLADLIGRIYVACQGAPVLTLVPGLLGTFQCVAAELPAHRAYIVDQLRKTAASIEAVGAADAGQAGTILHSQAEMLRQLQTLQAPPEDKQH